jgi:hypothetical protein
MLLETGYLGSIYTNPATYNGGTFDAVNLLYIGNADYSTLIDDSLYAVTATTSDPNGVFQAHIGFAKYSFTENGVPDPSETVYIGLGYEYIDMFLP